MCGGGGGRRSGQIAKFEWRIFYDKEQLVHLDLGILHYTKAVHWGGVGVRGLTKWITHSHIYTHMHT